MSQVYVSTYNKYNNGSLYGEWLDLSDYAGKEDFLEACVKLHSDESDPELMFQDWEDIPSKFIGESHIDETVWDWLALNSAERETVAIYLTEIDHNCSIQAALDSYDGEHESESDWARDFWEQTGMVSQLPAFAQNYIDYEQFARDCRLGGDITFVETGRKMRAFRRN